MKLIFIHLFSIALVGIFLSSCATAKHDFYYAMLEGVDLKQSPVMSDKFELDTICGRDSISFSLLVNGDNALHIDEKGKLIDIGSMIIECTTNGYFSIDKTRSSVTINDSIYPLSKEFDRYSTFYNENSNKHYNKYGYISSFRIPEKDLAERYSTYTDEVYTEKKEKIRGKKRTLYNLSFEKLNSPLLIDVHIIYYTDSLKTNQCVANLSLYQSQLIKIKDLRYNTNRRSDTYRMGEKISEEIPNVVFYTNSYAGTVWGWPEIRLGMAYTVSSVLLPFTIIANFFKLAGKNDWATYDLIEYPIFE